MSRFLLVLLLPWLLGLVVGVADVSFPALLVVLGILALWLVVTHWHSAYVVAAGVLCLFGYVWAMTYLVHPDSFTCPDSNHVSGTIIELLSGSAGQYRFILDGGNNCKALVRTSVEELYHTGQYITVKGKGELVSDMPDRFLAVRKHWQKKGVSLMFEYPNIIQEEQRNSFVSTLRTRSQARIQYLFPEPESSLASAMIFNEFNTIPESVVEHFRRTGVSHVLAISGSNISLLVGVLLLLFLPLQFPALLRSLLIIGIVWIYIFFIDMPVSAVRASFFWSIALLALRLSRLVNIPSIILLTVVAMASWYPPVLQDIGFQLSLAAVVGIALTLFLWRPFSYDSSHRLLTEAVLVSTGAILATWPVSVFWFGEVSLVSLPVNLLVVPLMSLIFVLMVLALLLGMIWPILSLPLVFGIHVLWVWVNAVTTFFAALSFGYKEELHMSALVVTAYYGVIVMVAWWILHMQKRSWREIWQ